MSRADSLDVLDVERATFLGIESTFATRPASLSRIACLKGSHLEVGLKVDLWENADERQLRNDNPARVIATQKDSKFGALKVQWKGIKTADKLDHAGTINPTLSHRPFLTHGFGGEFVALGCTVGVGSTTGGTTGIVVDSTAARLAGEIVLIELTVGAGDFTPATIAQVIDATHFTLVELLPSAPASTCRVRGMYNYYLPEIRQGTLTIEQAHTPVAGLQYRVLGCAGDLKIDLPDWTKIPTFTMGGACVAWQGPTALTGPTFGSPAAAPTAPAADDMDLPMIWTPLVWISGYSAAGAGIDRSADKAYRIEKMTIEFESAWDPIPDGSKPSTVGGWIDTAGRNGGVAAKGTLTIRIDPQEQANYLAGTTRTALVITGGAPYQTSVAALAIGQFYITATKAVSLGKGRAGLELTYEVRVNTTCTGTGASSQAKDLVNSPLRWAVG